MNVLEMFAASMYLLESIIKRLQSKDMSLTAVLSIALTAFEYGICMMENEKETTKGVKHAR